MSETTGKEVVNWKERLAARVQEVQEEEQPSVVTMSLASGVMSIMDQALPNNQLEGVILAMGTERTFYNREYDADDKSPPDCYAQKIGNDDTFNPSMTPAANVPEPQAPSCAMCPLSKMGTADRGKGPACKTRRRLVVAPASIVGNPDKIGKQVVLVSVPPTSGRNFGMYVNKLAANGLPPEAAVSRIKYGPSKKFMFEMNFEPVRPIEDDATLAAIFSKAGDFAPLLLGGYNYEQGEEDKTPESAPKGGKKKY